MRCDIDDGEQLFNVFGVPHHKHFVWEVKVSTVKSNPCIHIIGTFGLVSECPPAYKLDTIPLRLSKSYSMIVRTKVHCPRGIFAWPAQITSIKPSPVVRIVNPLYQSRRLINIIRVLLNYWRAPKCYLNKKPNTALTILKKIEWDWEGEKRKSSRHSNQLFPLHWRKVKLSGLEIKSCYDILQISRFGSDGIAAIAIQGFLEYIDGYPTSL